MVGARSRVGARSGAARERDARTPTSGSAPIASSTPAPCSARARALGDRVILQPGAVLGGDGFGYEFDEAGRLEKVPQLGVVVIEDDVEIGANATIDRARFGEHAHRPRREDRQPGA